MLRISKFPHSTQNTSISLPTTTLFFCWRLLGLIPGGTPFSQLNKGVKDAMVVSTELVIRQFMTKTCQLRQTKQTLASFVECTVFKEFKILRDFGSFLGFELLRSCCLRRRSVFMTILFFHVFVQ